MLLSLEHERLVRMIKESISLMCKSSLSYDIELNVEGLLGITLDKKDIFLVNIKESFQSNVPKENTEEDHTPQKRSRSDIIEIKEEEFEQLSSCSRKKRSRRRSHNNSPGLTDNSGAPTVAADYELPGFSAASPSERGHRTERFPSPSRQKNSSHVSSSQSRPERTDTSRDSVNFPGAMDTQSSGFSEDGTDFGSFVIKQEMGDPGGNDVIGDVDFSSESFEGHPLGGAGVHQQGPYPSMEHPESGPHPGRVLHPQKPPSASMMYLASGQYGSSFLPIADLAKQQANFPKSDEKLFKCRYCSKVFRSKGGKYNHQRLHTGKALKCENCGRLFISKSELQRHSRTCPEKSQRHA